MLKTIKCVYICFVVVVFHVCRSCELNVTFYATVCQFKEQRRKMYPAAGNSAATSAFED